MSGRSNPFGDIEELLDVMTGGLETQGDPPVDVVDEGDAFVVVADLPGYDRDDVEVTLVDATTLAVSATRESDHVAEADRVVTRERTARSVSRRIGLPDPVDEAETSATYEGGVLTVRLPKRSPDDESGTDIPVS